MLIETCYGFPVKLRVGPNKSFFRQEMNTFCGKEISRKIWGLMVKVVGGELPMWGNHHKPDQRTYFVNSTTNRASLRPAFHRQCSHLVPGHRARVLFYAGHQCEHTFFPGTHARIRARCRCPSTRSRPCTRALNWALSPCVNTFFVGALALYPQTTCFRTHNSLSHSRFQ